MHHYNFDDLEGTVASDHTGNADITFYGDFAWIGDRAEHDFISDIEGNDSIVIEDNITINDLEFWRSVDNEDSLIITLYDQSGSIELHSITIEDQFYNQPVENLVFGDESSVLISDLTITLNGDIENNILRGTDQKDEIYGHDGDDSLYGFAEDDVLYAGAGLDTLQGGEGADTFVLSGSGVFDGNLNSITDFVAADGDAISLVDLLEGYDPLTDAIGDFVILTTNANDTTLSVDRDGTSTTYASEQILVVENTNGQWTDAQDMLTQGHLRMV